MPTPRSFTHAELTHDITTGQYNAMSSADRALFDAALTSLWGQNYRDQTIADFAADHKRIGSREACEWGE